MEGPDSGGDSVGVQDLVVDPADMELLPSEDEGGALVLSDTEGARGVPSKKRKGKSTRWNIPTHALSTLEQVFMKDKFPTVETRKNLAADLKVTPRQVQVWFQNKRQRSVKPPSKLDSEPHEMLSTSVRPVSTPASHRFPPP